MTGQDSCLYYLCAEPSQWDKEKEVGLLFADGKAQNRIWIVSEYDSRFISVGKSERHPTDRGSEHFGGLSPPIVASKSPVERQNPLPVDQHHVPSTASTSH